MQTAIDPLLELRDEIERRQKEALAEEEHYKATNQPLAKIRAAGMWLALDKLLAHLDGKIDEAASVDQPSPVVRLQRMVRRLWETFDRRASTWQRDEGELGDIIATELRTLNNAYLELSDEVGKPPNDKLSDGR